MVDYIGRALVAEALEEWREQLQELATVSPLRDLALSESTVVDLRGSHPGGLAPLFAGRPTSLQSLLRDPDVYAQALHRVRLIREDADRVKAATGVWTAAMVIGTVSWAQDGRRREMPLVMRPVHFEPARQGDVLLTMLDQVVVNPVFLTEARARGAGEGLAGLHPSAGPGVEFDPRPLWSHVRALGDAFPDVEVGDRLFVGAFDDPEQRLLDDLDDMDAVIGASDVLAASAGDGDARAVLAQPLPAFPLGDRDPFAERGVGDLDDAGFAALDLIATGRSVLVQAPPGADPLGAVAAIVADAAASGRAVMAVGGGEQAVRAVARRLDRLGVGDTYVSGAMASWNQVARRRLLTSMTMGVDEVEDDSIREAGERLLAARHELQGRMDALHRSYRPWDVSAYEAVQAVVRLISTAPAPATPIRLGADAAALVAEHGFASVTHALVEAIAPPEPEPEAQEAPETPEITLVPWWSEVTSDPAEGARLDEALATLVVRHLPKMRAEARLAAHETGMDEAPTVAAWADQVTLFTDVRDTLEIFSPAVFHRSLHDLVAATAPAGTAQSGELARRDRRALRRRAVELLRPGRSKDEIHEHLVAAHAQALRWRAHCSAGGWPLVPADFDLFADRVESAQRLWERIAQPVAQVSGETDLMDQPWERVREVLEHLAEGVPGTLEAVEEIPVDRDLVQAGLGLLLEDLRAREATPEQVRRDLEFAWWAAAFDAIVSADPRLTEEGAVGRVVEEFLRRDHDFAAARVGPLMRAVAERRRIAIAKHPDLARDLFATLVEGADAPYRELWRDHGPLVTALRPVTLATAEQVSRLAPPTRCVDLAVVFASESLALAETVPTLARARQVVVVADAESATRSAVATFADLLPRVALHAAPQPRDPRVTSLLGSLAYGRALSSLPAAGEADRLRVQHVDAVGHAVAGSRTVESTRAEVAAVIERADRLVHEMPRRSLAVVAGNELHAMRLRDALEERGARLADTVPVVSLANAAGLDVDEVILSLGYARDAEGTLPARLGALSEPHGLPALVQALAATHESLTVVTALDAEQLAAIAEGPESEAVDGLRELLLAADGAPVPAERPEPAPGDWLLADIASRLRAQGYAVHVRYGAGADAIPLVVGGRHDRGYTVAVVTDDAGQAGAASVRDRMRHQYGGLEALGWTVVSLWTLDVFMDPDAAVAAIVDAVEGRRGPLVWEQPTLDLGVETSAIRVPAQEVFDVAALEDVTGAIPALRDDHPVAAEPEPEPDPEPAVEAPDVTLGISVMLAEHLLVDRHTRAQETQPALDLPEPEPEPDPEPDPSPEPEPARDAQSSEEAPVTPPRDAESSSDDDSTPASAPEGETEEPEGEAEDALPSPPPIRPAWRGTDRPLIPTRAREDIDEGWGGSGGSSRDDEIKRERPPHW
ncbi:hypothetical protein [Demequina lignilytica]|uniref:Restriction endonuclease type II-like domain-containing protein n=1 Tax=Demequina lignilytica TaxID=3051663 RepID=A0AB35MIJ0_9MICO|nr:hypothetical protein [Demequina sp. SYSU T0a273]MDN4483593.1 hypothetical protein [Demequina sp. SYSU T0a273]